MAATSETKLVLLAANLNVLVRRVDKAGILRNWGFAEDACGSGDLPAKEI